MKKAAPKAKAAAPAPAPVVTPTPKLAASEPYGVIVCVTNPNADAVNRGLIFHRGVAVFDNTDAGQVDAAREIVSQDKPHMRYGTVADAVKAYGEFQGELAVYVKKATDDKNLARTSVAS